VLVLGDKGLPFLYLRPLAKLREGFAGDQSEFTVLAILLLELGDLIKELLGVEVLQAF
jgi:hypothetical protein